jgi:hypothetical protein
MQVPSIQFQFVVLFVVAVFAGVMLHISSPEQCNIKGECISIDFNK